MPNHRSSHSIPVPRGGGIAGLLGATAAAILTNTRIDPRLCAGVLGLAAVGWLDDVTGHVPATARLAGQLGIGATALTPHAGDLPLAAVTTAGVVNVVNFMDGINGISALTALVWGANAMLLEDETGGTLADLGALTAGASLGFLPHNAPRARLFLGDVGSYALGTAMAAGILSQRSLRNRYSVAAPLLLYGVDAGQALLRRARSGKRLGEAHRDHVYQRLVDGGLGHGEVALVHAVGAALIAVASRRHPRVSIPMTVAVAVAYLCLPRVSKSPPNASVHSGLMP